MADDTTSPSPDLALPAPGPGEVWDLSVGITTSRFLGPPPLELIKGGASDLGEAAVVRRTLSLVASAAPEKPIRGRGCPCPACETNRF